MNKQLFSKIHHTSDAISDLNVCCCYNYTFVHTILKILAEIESSQITAFYRRGCMIILDSKWSAQLYEDFY